MKKWVKITLSVILIYLALSTIAHLIWGYVKVKETYSEQTYNYIQAKLCYECVLGKTDICPKINRDKNLAGYVEGINATYPNAKEYSGNLPQAYGGLPLDEKRKMKVSEINEELIIKNDYCYYRDWTENADYLSGFVPEPSKGRLYTKILTDGNFYVSILIAPIWLIICMFSDCSM